MNNARRTTHSTPTTTAAPAQTPIAPPNRPNRFPSRPSIIRATTGAANASTHTTSTTLTRPRSSRPPPSSAAPINPAIAAAGNPAPAPGASIGTTISPAHAPAATNAGPTIADPANARPPQSASAHARPPVACPHTTRDTTQVSPATPNKTRQKSPAPAPARASHHPANPASPTASHRDIRPLRHAAYPAASTQAAATPTSTSGPSRGADATRAQPPPGTSTAHPASTEAAATAGSHAARAPRHAKAPASDTANATSGATGTAPKLCGIEIIRSTFPRIPHAGKMALMAQPIRRPTGPPKPRMPLLLMRVWDAPTRLFHWAVVLLVLTSYISVKTDYIQLHYWSGYTMLTLLLFRLVWGFVGSETSRFGQFVRSPIEGFRHLAHFNKREPDREIGHNAAGGWMVLVMLAALALQATTGLFAGDPIDGGGPFVDQIAGNTQKLLDRVHQFNFNIILALIGLHVVTIIAYAAVKRHDLVRPMITGRKRLPATMRQPRFASPLLAALVLAGAAALVWAVVRFA